MKCRKGDVQRRRQRERACWQELNAMMMLLSNPHIVVTAKSPEPVVPDLVIPAGTKLYTGYRDDAGEMQWEFMGTTA